jgi:hypothetical protein
MLWTSSNFSTNFFRRRFSPLRQDMVVIGRAMPVLAVEVCAEKIADSANKLMEKQFDLMLEAFDSLGTNEVYVNTGPRVTSANLAWPHGSLQQIE